METNNTLLARYIAEPEHFQNAWVKVREQKIETYPIVISEYLLNSQVWPKSSPSAAPWQHRLMLYTPSQRVSTQALLFVNGGTRYIEPTLENPEPHAINFAKIASVTGSLVIDLQDIPNQYLKIIDDIPRMGDALLAYTWMLYLQNPTKNADCPLYFPMAKAVIKAMDAVQAIFHSETLPIKNFVLSGLSKRALAAWLAMLFDKRVNGLVPMVMDMLNTLQNMQHIYAFYNNEWPKAFGDFAANHLMAATNNPAFLSLMNSQDPLFYIQTNDALRKRAEISKYIISASGDDFFVPDSLGLYLHQLPGETRVRVIPNQSHFIEMNVVEEALSGFYSAFVAKNELPKMQWQFNQENFSLDIQFSEKPERLILWQALNPNSRDFRRESGINYESLTLENFEKTMTVVITQPANGWKAFFVEANFSHGFKATTEAYVIE